MERITLLKIIGLITGCSAKFVTGSLFVFTVYQNDIKDTFNYTQKEVEAMSSMLNVGLGIGFVPGMFYDRYGPRWTSTVGLVISVTSYLLLWSTTRSIKFYSSNSWLVVIYFLLCGFGSVFTYMVALNTNIINFNKKHTGKVVGLLNAFFAGSPSIYSVIYYNLFPKSTTVSIARSNFAGVMLIFAICFGIVDIMCIIFLRKYDDEAISSTSMEKEVHESRQENSDKDKNDDIVDSVPNDSTCVPSEEMVKVMKNFTNSTDSRRIDLVSNKDRPLTVKQILIDADYQIFIWLVAFGTTVGLVFINNITVISKASALDKDDKYLTLIIPITNTLVSASVGLFSDLVMHKLPRMWFLIFGGLCMLFSQMLVVFGADKLGLLILATMLVGIGTGIFWSISPTVVKEMYYIGNLGRNWGIAILLAGLLGLGAQEVFGALYDDEITTPGSTYCYGMNCLRGGTELCISFAVASVILGIVSQIRNYGTCQHLS